MPIRFIDDASQASSWCDDDSRDDDAPVDDGRLCWKTLQQETDTRDLIRNVETRLAAIELGTTWLPVTINSAEYANSYVCSTYTGAISYPLDELHKVDSRFVRVGLRGLIRSVAPFLRLGEVNRVVSVNNWLLSTNLYPSWNGAEIESITQMLVDTFPRHAVMFRSLNYATNADLCERFMECGYQLAPSRQVYMFDRSVNDYACHRDTERDRKLLERGQLCAEVTHESLANDDAAIEQLYNQLYLEKYSYCNPQFTAKLIRTWRESRTLRFHGLRADDGQLVGVVGLFRRGGVLSSPVVGYDTNRPQKWGLYRRLAAIVLREAEQTGLMLNLSSGAPQFKRNRGGQPEIEYFAVYTQHLPLRQRVVWRALGTLLNRVGRTVVTRFEL